MDNLSQRSHDLINRLERKFTIKVAMSNSRQHHATTVYGNEFNFPRISHRLKIIG